MLRPDRLDHVARVVVWLRQIHDSEALHGQTAETERAHYTGPQALAEDVPCGSRTTETARCRTRISWIYALRGRRGTTVCWWSATNCGATLPKVFRSNRRPLPSTGCPCWG